MSQAGGQAACSFPFPGSSALYGVPRRFYRSRAARVCRVERFPEAKRGEGRREGEEKLTSLSHFLPLGLFLLAAFSSLRAVCLGAPHQCQC